MKIGMNYFISKEAHATIQYAGTNKRCPASEAKTPNNSWNGGDCSNECTFLPAGSDFRALPLLFPFSGDFSAATTFAAAASSAAGAGRTTPPPPPPPDLSGLPDPNESLDCTHRLGRFALDDEGEGGGLAGDGDGVGVGAGSSGSAADPPIGMRGSSGDPELGFGFREGGYGVVEL
jgi:hypothetical protein